MKILEGTLKIIRDNGVHSATFNSTPLPIEHHTNLENFAADLGRILTAMLGT